MGCERRCRHCGEPLSRRAGEQARDWEERRACNRSCHVAWKNSLPPWERFAKFAVKTPGGCIEWTGNHDTKGYSRLETGGEVLAHRIAYMMQFGSIPEGMLVCHRCDNPGCVNPAHLFLGTNQDNMDDMVRKGRALRRYGTDNPNWRHGRNCTARSKRVA